ncbi:ABC transporter permease [Actinomadura luteofluorescens]|uniref:ABC transporter permease n=1 Tax=Actinomadura luteofluorescens TaxID=46163 RepID=UPI001794E86D|nr:ABC transporter permease [Actinomadura glauciflava]MCR3744001.1 ribose transport system permease protein [Actinomadura glauciflava]NUR27267.1 ABC transporter permease [Catenulispora sp.]
MTETPASATSAKVADEANAAAAGGPDDASGTLKIAHRSPLRKFLSTSPAYMGLVLALLVLLFSVLRPEAFPTTATGRNISLDISVLLVMAVGMTYVMVAGGFDLSIGSVLVFSGVVMAKTMSAIGGDGAAVVVAGMAASVLAGIAWGVLNGVCIALLKVPALITTLGTMGAALGASQIMTGGNDVTTVPDALLKITTSRPLGFSWLVYVAAVVALVGGLILAFTRFGRHTYLVGSNEESARRAGINVNRHLIKLYAVSGGLAGVAGAMSLTRFATTTISGHATDALQVITGVVLGGTSLFGGIGTILGTVVGIFIPAVLQNGFVVTHVQPYWQQVVIGFVLIAAVYVDHLKRARRDRS